jgi:hypothetical protein
MVGFYSGIQTQFDTTQKMLEKGIETHAVKPALKMWETFAQGLNNDPLIKDVKKLYDDTTNAITPLYTQVAQEIEATIRKAGQIYDAASIDKLNHIDPQGRVAYGVATGATTTVTVYSAAKTAKNVMQRNVLKSIGYAVTTAVGLWATIHCAHRSVMGQ